MLLTCMSRHAWQGPEEGEHLRTHANLHAIEKDVCLCTGCKATGKCTDWRDALLNFLHIPACPTSQLNCLCVLLAQTHYHVQLSTVLFSSLVGECDQLAINY